MSRWLDLAVGVLGVWRLTHLLAAEDGPAGILARFRRRLGEGFWGSLLDCFYCLSLWTAAPFALLLRKDGSGRCLLWLALSAGAILVERVTARPATFIEDKEDSNELLRTSQIAVSPDDIPRHDQR